MSTSGTPRRRRPIKITPGPVKLESIDQWRDESLEVGKFTVLSDVDREIHGLGFRQYYTGRVQPVGGSDEQFERTDENGDPVELQ